jgi:hypothetical protein
VESRCAQLTGGVDQHAREAGGADVNAKEMNGRHGAILLAQLQQQKRPMG